MELKKNNRALPPSPSALLAVVPSDDGARGVKDSSDRAACVRHSGSQSLCQSVRSGHGRGINNGETVLALSLVIGWNRSPAGVQNTPLFAASSPIHICILPPLAPDRAIRET